MDNNLSFDKVVHNPLYPKAIAFYELESMGATKPIIIVSLINGPVRSVFHTKPVIKDGSHKIFLVSTDLCGKEFFGGYWSLNAMGVIPYDAGSWDEKHFIILDTSKDRKELIKWLENSSLPDSKKKLITHQVEILACG